MSDSPIKQGDEVSWKWGSGNPSGTVAEIKTSGKLEIETAGKKVHKNSDAENPAVHVAREGNDVVKRASELTKENGAASTEEPKTEGQETKKVEEKEKGEEKPGEKEGEKEDREMKEASQSEKGTATTLTGSKRERVETPLAEEAEKPMEEKKVEEEVSAEKDTGKEVKRAKVEGEASVKHEGRDQQDKAKFVSNEKVADKVAEAIETSPVKTPKKKTATKAKKGGEDCPATYTDTPATRTRSKAS